MNFDFSEDQKLLADQVKRFLDDSCGAARVRDILDGDERYAEDVWQGLADMGLIGTAVPENFGGTGKFSGSDKAETTLSLAQTQSHCR